MPGTGSLALEARDQVIDLQPLSLHNNIHVFAFVYRCDVVPILALIIIRLQLHLCRNQQDSYLMAITATNTGAQWLSGRVLDSRPKGRGFEPHRRHCVVVLEQDTFILA